MGSPYKALADDVRREILDILSKSETKAGDIAENFDISKPAISNHLKILKCSFEIKRTILIRMIS